MPLKACDNINRSRCCDNQIDHLSLFPFLIFFSLTERMPGDDEVVGEFSLPSIIANAFVLLEGELIAAGLSRSI